MSYISVFVWTGKSAASVRCCCDVSDVSRSERFSWQPHLWSALAVCVLEVVRFTFCNPWGRKGGMSDYLSLVCLMGRAQSCSIKG